MALRPPAEIINWAFDEGIAQGDRNWWLTGNPTEAEWTHLMNTIRGALTTEVFENRGGTGPQEWWATISSDSADWQLMFDQFLKGTTTTSGGGDDDTLPGPGDDDDDLPVPEPEPEPEPKPKLDFYEQAALLFPYLPADLVSIYATSWSTTGDRDLAWASTVKDPTFDQYFPGIKRADGTLRMTPLEYIGTKAAYEDALFEVGVNPALFQSQFGDLITGEVSANEFRARVRAVETRILSQEAELKQIYSEYYGLSLDTAALVASVLDPAVGQDVIDRRIGIAEIGGEAALQGFALSREQSTSLMQAGLDQNSARQTFQYAGAALPSLSKAAERQNEGLFNLDSYLASQVYSDPRETQRLGRTLAGEASSFTPERTDVRRNQLGAITGLRQR